MRPPLSLVLCSILGATTCAGAPRGAPQDDGAFACAEAKLDKLYRQRAHRRQQPQSLMTYCFRDVQTARVWRDTMFASDHSRCETLDRNIPDPLATERGQPACVPSDAIERGPRTEDILGTERALAIDPTYRPQGPRPRRPASNRELAELFAQASPQLFVAPPENCDVDAPHPHPVDRDHPPFGLAVRLGDPEQEILRGEVLMAYVREGRKTPWELKRWCER